MKPRIGCIGLGWIGRLRLAALAAGPHAEVAALAEPDPERLAAGRALAPAAATFPEAERLLAAAAELALDGLVVATPNALHAQPVRAALGRGLAVFCQKPLGIDARETRALLEAARRRDRRLAVDWSYRFTDGARTLRRLLEAGRLGEVFHVESAFHNAYGPDKPWCWDAALAGGGALVDLGVHPLDLALWLLGGPAITAVEGAAWRDGRLLPGRAVDDFAVARVSLAQGRSLHVAVSWEGHTGRDCEIRTTLHGTRASAELRNVGGSFVDFDVVLREGRREEHLGREGDAWMGRAVVAWAERLRHDARWDPADADALRVSEVVDAVYAASAAAQAQSGPAPFGARPGAASLSSAAGRGAHT